jgi:hypothetical protein
MRIIVFGIDILHHLELCINLQGLVCGYFIASPIVTASVASTTSVLHQVVSRSTKELWCQKWKSMGRSGMRNMEGALNNMLQTKLKQSNYHPNITRVFPK